MAKKNKKRTLLVDGNSLFKTTFEASYSQFIKSSDTDLTKRFISDINGIYSFLMKLRITLDQGTYNNLRITFDSKNSGALRRAVYSDYKISRKKPELLTEEEQFKQYSLDKQKSRLQDYLTHFCHWYEDEVVEADDVIAYYVRNKEENEVIDIMTGDVDIMQLIQKNVSVIYLNKQFKTKTASVKKYEKLPYNQRKHLKFDRKLFIKFFDFPPENIPLIKTICGDDSDDIKNIKSVRETSLFNTFPEIKDRVVTIDEILDKCKNILSEENGKKPTKVAKHILEGITDGVQGKDIININSRLVDLSSDEFMTEECKSNLAQNGFLSNFKYEANDSIGLMNKMQEDGIYEHIKDNFKHYSGSSQPIKKFFKPFLKTIIKT
jgi:5'-3' exonuclease